jgi:hypothetical protein
LRPAFMIGGRPVAFGDEPGTMIDPGHDRCFSRPAVRRPSLVAHQTMNSRAQA